MKVVILCFSNMRGVPYIYPYINLLKKQGAKYDIIYWNRHGISESLEGSTLIAWNKSMRDDTKLFKKFFYMSAYARFVKRILKKNRYDKIIVLNPILAILLYGFLHSNYKNKYIIDIRDHSYEHINFYYKRLEKAMKDAELNVVSSNGFKEFLPKIDTVLCHNYSATNVPANIREFSKSGKIRIAFIGQVRYSSAYLDFLKKISNHDRVDFSFYGFGDEVDFLKKFCKKNDIKNVKFHGAYAPNEKGSIIEQTDVLFNVYGNDLHVKYAISNKYYDALVYKRPLLVSKGTLMEEIASGFCFAVDENFKVEEFFNWYDSLNYSKLVEQCNQLLEQVYKDQENFDKKVTELL